MIKIELKSYCHIRVGDFNLNYKTLYQARIKSAKQIFIIYFL